MTESNKMDPPPTLGAAASIIRHYGERHGLTPSELLDIFHAGILAQYIKQHKLEGRV